MDKSFLFDKSKWGAGPWQDEPDRLEFEHLGFPCLILRVPGFGHLCGYVAVPPGHPWHGADLVDGFEIEIHGNVTYASKCKGNVCHVPKLGEPEDVYWIGFDHAHAGDISPGERARYAAMSAQPYPRRGGIYRDLAYVRAGCQSLAAQALARGARS